MHDLIAAKEISDAVLKEASKNKLKKVTKIVIDFGKWEEHGEIIKKENLKFHFNHLFKGTIAEKAKIVFNEIKSPQVILKEIEGE